MPLVRIKVPDEKNLTEEQKAFWRDAYKKHGEHKDSGFFDEPEKPIWDLGDDMDTPEPTNVESPSFKEKATSLAYGFNKGLGKTVDSVAAAGNALYGATASGLETTSSLVGADSLAKDFSSLKEQAYSDAGNLWNGKVAEQYVEDNKPEAIDKYANTDQKHVIDNWVSAGHTMESLVEMSGGGAVLKLGGKGIAALTGSVLEKGAKNPLVNNKATSFLNTLLTVPITPTNVAGAGVGGYLANDFRSQDEVVRENTPIEDTARTLGGYIAGDIAVRGGYGAVTGGTKFILEKTLPKNMYNSFMKTVENFSTEYKEPFVKGVENALDSTQETVGNWVNGMVFKANTPNGKLTMQRVREIEQVAKDSIEYVSETSALGKTQSSFGTWLLGKKGNEVDMDFIEAVSPELANMIKRGGDKKEIMAELIKNKELISTYTVQKNNQKALDIAMYLPEYTLQEKMLKTANNSIIDRIKQNVFNFTENESIRTFTHQVDQAKHLIPQFQTALKNERNLHHEYYKKILEHNKSFISATEFLPQMKKLADEFKIFSPSKNTNSSDIATIEKLSSEFSNIYNSALNAENMINGSNIIKNYIDPVALINKRQSLNELAYSGNNEVEKLYTKAISLIDSLLEYNTNIKNLPEEFLTNYRKALDFDSKVYFSFTQNEIIKTLTTGEPTHYLSNIMETPAGVELLRESLLGTTKNYNRFHFNQQALQSAEFWNKKILNAYERGEISSTNKDFNKTYYGSNVKKADLIDFPTDKPVKKTAENIFKDNYTEFEKIEGRYKNKINNNKEIIQKLDGNSKNLFDALCQVKFKKLLLEDFVNYKKTGGKFDFEAFKTQSTILSNENLIRSLLRDDVKIDFVIKKLPLLLNKVGELGERIRPSNIKNKSDSLSSSLSKFTLKTGGASIIGTGLGIGPVGGAVVGATIDVGWNMFMRGVANSFNKPETTLKLINLIEKGDDKKVLKFLLKQANIYSYNIIKNDVGGSKEYLKEKVNKGKEFLLEPQTVPWNER